MRDYRAELVTVLGNATDIAQRRNVGAELLASSEELESQIKQWQPTLMFYGFYNAGKSTLLNALLGDDLAKTADQPCTVVVSEFNFHGYRVYDAPGIDAPVEHEAVAMEQIERCHVILFVVESGGAFEEAQSAEEVAKLLRRGRRTIVVLNDKHGLSVNSDEVLGLRARFRDNIARADAGAEAADFDIYMVNALTALRARKSKNEEFIEASGLNDIEQVVLRALKENSGVSAVVLPATRLAGELTNMREALGQRLSSDEAKAAEAFLQKLHATRVAVLGNLSGDLHGLRSWFVPVIEDCMRRGQDTLDGGPLEDYVERANQKLERRLTEAFDVLGEELRDLAARIDAESPDLDEAGPEDEETRGDGWVKRILGKVDAKEAARLAESKEGIDAIKQGMLFLRKLKVPGFKGRWSRTLGKWAGKAGKGLGVALQLAQAAFELKKAHDAQAKYEEDQRRQRERLRSHARSAAEHVEDQVMVELRKNVLDAFSPLEARAKAELEREARESDDVREDLARLTTWSGAVATVLEELRSVGVDETDAKR